MTRWLCVAMLAIALPVSAQQPVQQTQAISVSGTLQNAAVANGNGTSLRVDGQATAVLTVNCALCSGTQVNFYVSENSTDFVLRPATQVVGAGSIPNPPVSSTTQPGVTVWEVPVSGFVLLRASISNYVAGTVTVTGHTVPIGQPSVTFATAVGASQSPAPTVPAVLLQPTTRAAPIIGLRLYGALGEPLGDAVPLRIFATNPLDGCVDLTKAASVPISQAANAQLIAGIPGRRIYICQLTVIGADAENMSLVEGAGTTCATSTLAVIGATTAANGMNFAANSGVAAGIGASWIAASTVVGNSVCLFQSGSGRVAGSIKYFFQ